MSIKVMVQDGLMMALRLELSLMMALRAHILHIKLPEVVSQLSTLVASSSLSYGLFLL
jgi:hypothetical protein